MILKDAGLTALPNSASMPGRSEVLDDMIAAIRSGRPPLHNGRPAKANVEVSLALLRSARERREIVLEHQAAFDHCWPQGGDF